MTRSSKLTLVTLLAGLLSLASVTAVSADTACTGYAQEHCEELAAADAAILFQAAIAVAPMHLLSGNGMGQEHFEEMATVNSELFGDAPAPSATATIKYGQEHYEEIMAATGASN